MNRKDKNTGSLISEAPMNNIPEPEKNQSKKPLLNKTTTIIFCALLGIITVASMVNPVRESSETENRSLAQMPELSVKSIFSGTFEKDYETFITDQFVARDAWINLRTKTELLLGKREANNVYFAKDGYYIENVSPDKEASENNLKFLADFINDMSGTYRVRALIAPTALSILSDKLPLNAPAWDENGYLDRIASLCPENTFVDTRGILSEHENDYVYYRTDHHWTTYGAYLAYTELCASLGIEPIPESEIVRTTLSDKFYGTIIAKVGLSDNADTLEKFESENQPSVSLVYDLGARETDTLYADEKLSTRDKYGVFLGGNDAVVDVTTSVKNGKTLVLVKDSYSHCMLPLLANHYERIILVDLRSFNMGIESFVGKYLANEGVTVDDIVVLYNASGFADDRYLVKLGK